MKTIMGAMLALSAAIGLLLSLAAAPAATAQGQTKSSSPPRPRIRFVDPKAAGNLPPQGRQMPAFRTAEPAGRSAVRTLLGRKVAVVAEGMKLGEFARELANLGGVEVVLDRNS